MKKYWEIYNKYYKTKPQHMKKFIEFMKKWYPIIRDAVVAILAAIEGTKHI